MNKYPEDNNYEENPYRQMGTRNLWTSNGIMKFLEIFLLLATILVHRHGDNGNYVFFGTATLQMSAVTIFFWHCCFARAGIWKKRPEIRCP